MKKNYRLRDLLLTSEENALLHKIAEQLGTKPTEIARLILRERLKEITSEGFESFTLAIIGTKKRHKTA